MTVFFYLARAGLELLPWPEPLRPWLTLQHPLPQLPSADHNDRKLLPLFPALCGLLLGGNLILFQSLLKLCIQFLLKDKTKHVFTQTYLGCTDFITYHEEM